MSSNKDNNQNTESTEPKFNYYWIYGVILVAIIAINLIPFNSNVKKISEQNFFNEFFTDANHHIDKLVIVNKETAEVYIKEEFLGNEEHKTISDSNFSGLNKGPHYTFKILSPENFDKELRTKQATFPNDKRISIYPDTRTDWRASFITYFLPIIIIIAIWILIMRRVSGGVGGPGGQIFNIGKSKAVLLDSDAQIHITFDDVAGLDEAKEEVLEVVDFLRTPQKYTSLGGKIPKGVLLIGPPGTGKTLLAKAVAGEAKVPFFTISGSDFVELFVGVGASRVRDLFKQAREKAPCIIFIDEIDAIGRARGRNMMQGNDERENTLNALLVEMDGFAGDKGVIIMAATNRPDVLDSALLRPGRFDRQISIDAPDIKGREAIFKVHTTPIKTGDDINTRKLAEQTPGFAGADIANVCNEAALIAARKNKKTVTMIDFQDAIDRVIGGLEKKNKIISPEEKKIIAYHEAGHAIAGWFLKYGHPLLKVTIIPRGVAALGYAQYVPKERYLATIEQLIDGMCVTLGGRVAEDIIFNEISTGAQNDLERITKMAYSMVTIYGMNEKVGNVSFHDPNNEYNFQKPYSNETAQLIDKEVRTIIKNAYDKTKILLLSKRHELEILAEELLEKEILHKDDVERLIGKRPFAEHTEEVEDTFLDAKS